MCYFCKEEGRTPQDVDYKKCLELRVAKIQNKARQELLDNLFHGMKLGEAYKKAGISSLDEACEIMNQNLIENVQLREKDIKNE